MVRRPNCLSHARITGLPSRPGRLGTLLLIVVLSALSGRAGAGDLEDCNAGAPDKIEAACTAVIDDASRPADDRLKAYANRARQGITGPI